jgi:hypothetical protein
MLSLLIALDNSRIGTRKIAVIKLGPLLGIWLYRYVSHVKTPPPATLINNRLIIKLQATRTGRPVRERPYLPLRACFTFPYPLFGALTISFPPGPSLRTIGHCAVVLIRKTTRFESITNERQSRYSLTIMTELVIGVSP